MEDTLFCYAKASQNQKCAISSPVSYTHLDVYKRQLPLLFDRFHKADKSRSADREGWGLGLYIAKTIVGAYGGDIWATSENGITNFIFTLPTVR